MAIIIRSYSEEYLEDHVELGMELTSEWQFFGQTPLQIMRQQYDEQDFDPDTRLYAFDDVANQLVGFQTAQITRPGFARVEFPIVNPDYPEVMEMLFEHQLEVLRSKGVTKIQSRASAFWGNTYDLAQKFGYEYERDLYFVTSEEPADLIVDSTSITHLTLREYNAVKHAEQVRNILISCFDTSETLANAYLMSYQEQQPRMHLNHIMTEQGRILCRITLSTFQSGDKNMAISTIYTDMENADLLPEALQYLDQALLDYSYSSLHIYLAGLSFEQMSAVIDTSSVDPVISFYTKEI